MNKNFFLVMIKKWHPLFKKAIIEKILSITILPFEHIFFRKRLCEYNFYAGTTNFKESISIIKALLKGKSLQDGQYIAAYEKGFRDYLGVKHAFSFATGRMGLYVILKALGLKEGDEIIIPGYTCVVVPNAIIYAGIKPVYVDIDPKTFNIDVAKIEEKITSKTKALYAQHTFGLVCDVEEIQKIASKHNLPVIEDCCIALGAELNGKKAGTFGTVAYFSTDHSKVTSTSSGGMVVTNNESLAKRIEQQYRQSPFCSRSQILRMLFTLVVEDILRDPIIYFWGKYVLSLLNRLGFTFFFTDYYSISKPTRYPFPARLSNLQAMIGLSQLKLLEKIIAHQRAVARRYDEKLNIYSDYFKKDSRRHIFLRYVFLVEEPSAWKKAVEKYLEMESWYDSVTECRRNNFHEINYAVGSCLKAEWVSKHTINLPTHLKIKSPKTIIKIIEKMLRMDNPEYKVIEYNC